MNTKLKLFNLKKVFLFSLFFIISWIIMWKTLKVTDEGNLKIASKAWSDFAATIPLIRSFSFGSNFPPQYPIFAGPPIRYHFIFFFLVGMLEKIGLPLDWALNSLSTISFFLLLIAIYAFSELVFKSKKVAILSVILFLFNGSLAFLEFFKKHPLSFSTPMDIVRNTNFSSFGPYDGKIVSAFWSLNIFTNQRHLALAYSIYLLFFLFIYKHAKRPDNLTFKKAFTAGIIIGLLPFVHLSIFGMIGVSLILLIFIYPKLSLKIITIGAVAFLLSIPQLVYMGKPEIKTSLFNPGYLVENLSVANFLTYWLLNLGLVAILAPIGFLVSKNNHRKVFIPFLSFFIIGNLFQFTPDIPTNHKFFNLFVIGANMFAAYLLVKIWKKKILGKIIFITSLFFLTLSGIIDLFPILNDPYITLEDLPNNNTAFFIKENTPNDATFLNARFLYDPASLAGRKIFMGWPYFSWGAGYDTNKRYKQMKKLLYPESKPELCLQLNDFRIDYVEIQNPTQLHDTPIKYEFFEKEFIKFYHNTKANISIYDVKQSCKVRL